METRVTVISDTHWRHQDLELPAGDILIHCGDMFNISSDKSQIRSIDAWFGKQRFAHRLCTGGNHDLELESETARHPQPFRNAHFLKQELVEVRGLRIFGAPWVPDLPRHAFFKSGAALAEAWAQVPAGIDILVTHTPPKGILDMSSSNRSFGCAALAREMGRIAPRVHCFGHVHASAGHRQIGETLFINAASFDSRTRGVRPPISFTLSSGA